MESDQTDNQTHREPHASPVTKGHGRLRPAQTTSNIGNTYIAHGTLLRCMNHIAEVVLLQQKVLSLEINDHLGVIIRIRLPVRV